jgi:hypothetical protein
MAISHMYYSTDKIKAQKIYKRNLKIIDIKIVNTVYDSLIG